MDKGGTDKERQKCKLCKISVCKNLFTKITTCFRNSLTSMQLGLLAVDKMFGGLVRYDKNGEIELEMAFFSRPCPSQKCVHLFAFKEPGCRCRPPNSRFSSKIKEKRLKKFPHLLNLWSNFGEYRFLCSPN